MNWRRKLIIMAALTTIYQLGCFYLFDKSFAGNANNKATNDFIVISGKVIDKNTFRPVAGATVDVQIDGSSIKVVTLGDGQYYVHLGISSWLSAGTITVSADEYKSRTNYLSFFSWKRTIKMDFKLADCTNPKLEIFLPLNGKMIFTDSVIELRYSDNGSGIDVKSAKITACGRDLSKYIKIIDNQRAICVLPQNNLLAKGDYYINARIKDKAGNAAAQSVFVTVVDKAGYFMVLGKKALVDRKILLAYNYFNEALAAAPKNPEANFYFAFLRLAILPLQEDVFMVLQEIGFKGPAGVVLTKDHLDLFHFQGELAPGVSKFNLPGSFPNGQKLYALIKDNVIPELDRAIGNLNIVLAKNKFVSYVSISNPLTGSEQIEIDYGDVALLKSFILVIKSKLFELLVRDFNVDCTQLSALFTNGMLTPEYVLGNYPDLLRVKEIPYSLQARQALVLAINTYCAGFTSILAEKDDQSDDLISINSASEYRKYAMAFVQELQDIKKSLLGQPDNNFSLKLSQVMNMGNYFTQPPDLRRILDNDAATYLLKDIFLPQLDYLAFNFSKAKNKYEEFIPPSNVFISYGGAKKRVNFADISTAGFGVEAMRMGLLTALAYDLGTNVQEIMLTGARGGAISIQDILQSYPHLLYLNDRQYLYSAVDAFNSLKKRYKQASNYLSNHENSSQKDDILVVSDYFRANTSRYEAMLEGLSRMQNTLIDPRVEITADEFHVNLGELFVRSKEIRPFLPQFDRNNKVVPGTWLDETFGGILPDNKF